MIVVDTSALVSITIGDALEVALDEYDVHTTRQVLEELQETAAYDDAHGNAAADVLDSRDRITVHEDVDPDGQTSRVDVGEGSCVRLARSGDAAFLITDDLRALPELQTLTDAKVAISPILLRALVTRGVLTESEARDRLDRIAASRDWLGAPIYRRAQRLFE